MRVFLTVGVRGDSTAHGGSSCPGLCLDGPSHMLLRLQMGEGAAAGGDEGLARRHCVCMGRRGIDLHKLNPVPVHVAFFVAIMPRVSRAPLTASPAITGTCKLYHRVHVACCEGMRRGAAGQGTVLVHSPQAGTNCGGWELFGL